MKKNILRKPSKGLTKIRILICSYRSPNGEEVDRQQLALILLSRRAIHLAIRNLPNDSTKSVPALTSAKPDCTLPARNNQSKGVIKNVN